jgi:CRP-like cAMP-binding protein
MKHSVATDFIMWLREVSATPRHKMKGLVDVVLNFQSKMSHSDSHDPQRNAILSALSPTEFHSLKHSTEIVPYKEGSVLFRQQEVVRWIYFPLGGVISMLTNMQDGKSVEVGLVGTEGMAGISEVLGAKKHLQEAVIQVPDVYCRIEADAFRAEVSRRQGLRSQIDRYIRFWLAQSAQTTACNRVHRVEQRLARWLLMTWVRVRNTEFPATHEFLAHMLGSDRSGVTIAAGMLRSSGLIAYQRGHINILDLQGLKAAACECFGAVDAALSDTNLSSGNEIEARKQA